MRQFIIGEDVLGAVAQCIGAATHQVPYGQVAALVQRLDTLPQVQAGTDGKVQAAGADDKPNGSRGERARSGKRKTDAQSQPGEPIAPLAKNV